MSRASIVLPQTLPAARREDKPRIHAIKINANRPDGLPDGVHCGAWLDLDTREVWKSLYGRPYINSDIIVQTKEAAFLANFANRPYFPRNWRMEQSNGQNWIVRKEAHVLAPEEYKDLSNKIVLGVEQAIRAVNQSGWAINDYITLAVDLDSYDYFILDCSTASQDTQADDWLYIKRFFELCQRTHLVTLRETASHTLHQWIYNLGAENRDDILDIARAQGREDSFFDKVEERKAYHHIYASFNRPISTLWASSLDNAKFIHERHANWDKMIPWTWIITIDPLPDTIITDYELRWGWSRK